MNYKWDLKYVSKMVNSVQLLEKRKELVEKLKLNFHNFLKFQSDLIILLRF